MILEKNMFEGIPVSLELVTTNTETESETQTIAMSVDGNVTVDGDEVEVSSIEAMNLVHTVASYFRTPYTPKFDDSDYEDEEETIWELTIKNDDGESWEFAGDFGDTLLVGQHNLSDLIRSTLKKDVWAFDGNTQDVKIVKVELSYFGEDPDKYTEKVVVEREPESIKFDKVLKNGMHVAQQVAFATRQEVTGPLSELEQSFFFQEAHKQRNALIEMFKSHKKYKSDFYKIDITYADGTSLSYSDTFDMSVMPLGFAAFIFQINLILMESVGGALLAPFNLHQLKNTRSHEYIFVSVSFHSSDTTYYYTTTDKTIEVGDKVVVPVGEYNSLKIVDVEKVEHFAYDDLPMPLYKVKEVVQKVDLKNK